MDDSQSASPGVAQQLQRMENQLTEINARIARLAMALGVSLENEHQIRAALTSLEPPPVAVERRTMPDRRSGARSGGRDRRMGATRMELRGLLVLRYGTELRFVEQVGAHVTRHVMQEVERRMERRGFEPGSDGMHVEGGSRTS